MTQITDKASAIADYKKYQKEPHMFGKKDKGGQIQGPAFEDLPPKTQQIILALGGLQIARETGNARVIAAAEQISQETVGWVPPASNS